MYLYDIESFFLGGWHQFLTVARARVSQSNWMFPYGFCPREFH